MSWYSLFKVGIEQIDAEHEAIDSLIARAHLVEGVRHEYVGKVVTALLDHFRHEEELCRHLGMPLKRAHMREHERLTVELLALNSQPSDDATVDTLQLIQRLMRDHVNAFDQHITADEAHGDSAATDAKSALD